MSLYVSKLFSPAIQKYIVKIEIISLNETYTKINLNQTSKSIVNTQFIASSYNFTSYPMQNRYNPAICIPKLIESAALASLRHVSIQTGSNKDMAECDLETEYNGL